MSNESTINFVFVSRLNDGAAEIRIETNSRTALQDALVHLGLASTASFGAAILGAPVNEATQAPVAEQTAETKPKKSRAAKAVEEPVAVPVEETAQTPEPEAEVAVEVAAEVAAPVEAVAKATVEEAAAAVRAYGAKHGLDAARALLQKHGFARTTEVTADKAGHIVAEAAL